MVAPVNEMDSRVESLNRQGILGVYWGTDKGVHRTAEMLQDYRDDDEKTAMIFIAASLWGIRSHVPEEWRGTPVRCVRKVLNPVLKEMRDQNMRHWHAATKKPLPVQLVRHS